MVAFKEGNPDYGKWLAIDALTKSIPIGIREDHQNNNKGLPYKELGLALSLLQYTRGNLCKYLEITGATQPVHHFLSAQ